MPDTVSDVFEEIPRQFDPATWGTQNAILLFNITGDDAGSWTVNIVDGKVTVDKSAASNPDMTVTTTAADMLAIVNGELNSVSAFMQGRVRIDGDMSLAMKLQTLLSSA